MAEINSTYSIPIDGRWSLEDLYRFPRAFEQVYFALEAVTPTATPENEDRIARAFEAYPWRGGYSAVSFYNHLKAATPVKKRPVITRIYYSSPGVIEIALDLPVAVQVGSVVSFVASQIALFNKIYNTIVTDLQKRKLLRIEVERKNLELTQEEFKAVLAMSEQMAQLLDLGDVEALHLRTRDPLKSLKILLSIYRRVRTLAEFKIKKKANLRSLNELINDGDY